MDVDGEDGVVILGGKNNEAHNPKNGGEEAGHLENNKQSPKSGGSKLTWATQPGFSSFMLSQAEPLLTLTTSKCMEWEADSAASLCLRL